MRLTLKAVVGAIAASVALVFAVPSRATTLIFSWSEYGGGGMIPAGYGDHVAGPSPYFNYGAASGYTPHIGVVLNAVVPGHSHIQPNSGGSAYDRSSNLMVSPTLAATGLQIQFAADAGYNVVLNEFKVTDVAYWLPNPQKVSRVAVTNGGTELFVQSDIPIYHSPGASSPGGADLDFRFSPSLVANTLTIDLDMHEFGWATNLGIGFVSFSETRVPEPAVLAPLLALIALSRRQRATLKRCRALNPANPSSSAAAARTPR